MAFQEHARHQAASGHQGRLLSWHPCAFSCLPGLPTLPEPPGTLPGGSLSGGCTDLDTETGQVRLQPWHFLGL